MSDLDADALDRWITGGRYNSTRIQVWCQNPECETFDEEPVEVLAQSEYGSTWWTPDECPHCGGELDESPPR